MFTNHDIISLVATRCSDEKRQTTKTSFKEIKKNLKKLLTDVKASGRIVKVVERTRWRKRIGLWKLNREIKVKPVNFDRDNLSTNDFNKSAKQ